MRKERRFRIILTDTVAEFEHPSSDVWRRSVCPRFPGHPPMTIDSMQQEYLQGSWEQL
jgi:hypothetical protein